MLLTSWQFVAEKTWIKGVKVGLVIEKLGNIMNIMEYGIFSNGNLIFKLANTQNDRIILRIILMNWVSFEKAFVHSLIY